MGPEVHHSGGIVYAPIEVGQIVVEWVFIDDRGRKETRFSFSDDVAPFKRHQDNRISYSVRFWEVATSPIPQMREVTTIGDQEPPSGSVFKYRLGDYAWSDSVWDAPAVLASSVLTMRQIG